MACGHRAESKPIMGLTLWKFFLIFISVNAAEIRNNSFFWINGGRDNEPEVKIFLAFQTVESGNNIRYAKCLLCAWHKQYQILHLERGIQARFSYLCHTCYSLFPPPCLQDCKMQRLWMSLGRRELPSVLRHPCVSFVPGGCHVHKCPSDQHLLGRHTLLSGAL